MSLEISISAASDSGLISAFPKINSFQETCHSDPPAGERNLVDPLNYRDI